MYLYNRFDEQFVRARAAQYRDQLQRHLTGQLPEEEFRPLRLQNGWYVQRFAPMLRVAVPYGEISSRQLRALAHIAREYDQPHPELVHQAQERQDQLGPVPLAPQSTHRLQTGVAHFTTRQNVQFNWIPLERSADVMDLLAEVNMHGIQTSGNCIRNITTDALAGIAVDELADPRPFCEILRQWSTLHPEFAFLPRKFKIAVSGAREDRAAIAWHDVGLRLTHSAEGALGFQVLVGGGMGRTPVIASEIRAFLPWDQVLNYVEAVVRVYNLWGRRDNKYKARIKILVRAEGARFVQEVEAEFGRILEQDGAPHTITQAELDRVQAALGVPERTPYAQAPSALHDIIRAGAQADAAYSRWLKRNVHPHRVPGLRAVTLAFKRAGQAPGDANADQLDAAAQLADRFSAGEARVTHEQNLLLPWVREDELPELWHAAAGLGLARAHVGLLTDMIACPGGDYCSLANARSLPIAQAITERFHDLDELEDLGPIDLHISGCINSCGHHHSGHIGILGVDKDGREWYQITLGGSDGSEASGAPTPGRVIGPSFSALEVVEAVDAVLESYTRLRSALALGHESFVDTVRRLGVDPFRQAADAARVAHTQEVA